MNESETRAGMSIFVSQLAIENLKAGGKIDVLDVGQSFKVMIQEVEQSRRQV